MIYDRTMYNKQIGSEDPHKEDPDEILIRIQSNSNDFDNLSKLFIFQLLFYFH